MTKDPLLVVEDSNADFKMLERLIQRMDIRNPILRCSSGDEALDYLQAQDNLAQSFVRPAVILLDLNLPGTDGRHILVHLKQDRAFREIPIVVFTTSDTEQDIEFCYNHGANGYMVKPMNNAELQKSLRSFVDYWLSTNSPPPPWAAGSERSSPST